MRHIRHIHLRKLDGHLRRHKLCWLRDRHTHPLPRFGGIVSLLFGVVHFRSEEKREQSELKKPKSRMNERKKTNIIERVEGSKAQLNRLHKGNHPPVCGHGRGGRPNLRKVHLHFHHSVPLTEVVVHQVTHKHRRRHANRAVIQVLK